MEINCNVVKDLLPAYTEASCNDYTTAVIDEHMTKCHSCKQVLENFKKHRLLSHNNDPQRALKLVRNQRNIFIVITGILFSIILAAAAISCKLLIVGSTVPTAMVNTEKFEMKDEKTLSYNFSLLYLNRIINKVEIAAPDEAGNVYIKVNAVFLSPTCNPYIESESIHSYNSKINAVYLQGKSKNDIIALWEKREGE